LGLDVHRAAREWARLARALPGDLSDVVQGLRAGTLSVHLEHRRLDPVVNRLVVGLLTSSLLLGSSLLWSMHAPPLVSGVSLFGAVGYALAVSMAIRLLRTIRRSERPRENR
jgi:ubiquinone biosynthesis protein